MHLLENWHGAISLIHDYMQPTSSCGNKFCDANESSSNCPSDCVDLTLVTTYDYDYETSCHGNMFSVYSRADVVITSLAINSMNQGEGAVKVYTRHGR